MGDFKRHFRGHSGAVLDILILNSIPLPSGVRFKEATDVVIGFTPGMAF